jgi:hypothetical protein
VQFGYPGSVEGTTTSSPSRGANAVERAIELPTSAAAPVQARRAVAAFPGIGGDVGYRALLLTSEAVTAAVLAAETQPCDRIQVRAAISADALHIEVDTIGPPEAPVGVVLSPYARRIFDRTATRWGAGRGRPAIWFDLKRGQLLR